MEPDKNCLWGRGWGHVTVRVGKTIAWQIRGSERGGARQIMDRMIGKWRELGRTRQMLGGRRSSW